MESDIVAELLIAGALAYLFGRAPFIKWEGFINGFKKRVGHLSYNRIIEPLGFYEKVENGRKLYGEGVYSYLFGLPNSSLPTMFRCLETGLKQKYREVEGKEPSLNAFELIEWGERYLKNRKELAHGFRYLRNLIHEERVVEEQDTLEAIRHITKILNLIFTFPFVILKGSCEFCKNPYEVKTKKEICYLGSTISIRCNTCRRSTKHEIMASYL